MRRASFGEMNNFPHDNKSIVRCHNSVFLWITRYGCNNFMVIVFLSLHILSVYNIPLGIYIPRRRFVSRHSHRRRSGLSNKSGVCSTEIKECQRPRRHRTQVARAATPAVKAALYQTHLVTVCRITRTHRQTTLPVRSNCPKQTCT